MDLLLQDIRYGIRTLVQRPGFTFVAVLTLALGIGANTAIFSVVNTVLLRPLPYPEPERLMMLWETNPRTGGGADWVSPPNYLDWRDRISSFSSIAAFQSLSANLTGGGEPERVLGERVSSGFFETLRTDPALGRVFLPEEDVVGNDQVVVLSHSLWQRRYGADPGILGQTISLNNEPHTVVGVMPEGFGFLEPDAVLWAPLSRVAAIQSRGSHQLRVVGRLKYGVSADQARAEMTAVTAVLAEQYPDTNEGWGGTVIPVLADMVSDVESTLFILFGTVGFVLLIACANVANLLLSRAAGRAREIAIRTAVGAGRGRLIRQLLTESVLLAVIGGALGCLFALWGRDLIAAAATDIPRLDQVTLDAHVLAVTLLLSLITGILAGLAPALHAHTPDVQKFLKEGGRGILSGTERRGVRNLLVIAEVAPAFVLLVGAGLMVRSFINLNQVEPGFRTDNILTVRVSLPRGTYTDSDQLVPFYQQTLQRIKTLPGVQSASMISDLPLTGGVGYWNNGFTRTDLPPPPPDQMPFGYLRWIGPDYFETMGIPVQRGRVFEATDTQDRPTAVVVDEILAQRYFPNADPIGKQLDFNGRTHEIIGIVHTIRQTALDLNPDPQMYVSYFQTPQRYGTYVIRTAGSPMGLIAAVKEAIHQVDPDQPIYNIRTMDQVLETSLASRQFSLSLLGVFAALALILASMGIYSVLAYAVSQQIHEIGVRMALGAGQGDILTHILKHGLLLAGTGIAIGLAAAAILTSFLSDMLFNVSTTDPITYLGLAAVLCIVSLAACYIPARRAMQVDPMTALRCE